MTSVCTCRNCRIFKKMFKKSFFFFFHSLFLKKPPKWRVHKGERSSAGCKPSRSECEKSPSNESAPAKSLNSWNPAMMAALFEVDNGPKAAVKKQNARRESLGGSEHGDELSSGPPT